MPNRQTAYTTWVSFAQAAEANSWSRFSAFLVCTTLLGLTWGAQYGYGLSLKNGLPGQARFIRSFPEERPLGPQLRSQQRRLPTRRKGGNDFPQ
jgi:hypothetical protein